MTMTTAYEVAQRRATLKGMEIATDKVEREIKQLLEPTVPGAWQVFGDAGMIWLCNRVLRLFGWQLNPDITEDGTLLQVVPERIESHRGRVDLDRLMNVPGMLASFLRDHIDTITEDLS